MNEYEDSKTSFNTPTASLVGSNARKSSGSAALLQNHIRLSATVSLSVSGCCTVEAVFADSDLCSVLVVMEVRDEDDDGLAAVAASTRARSECNASANHVRW